jgi:hypothetical protein
VFTIVARDANDNPLSTPITPALTISAVRQDTTDALEFTASETSGRAVLSFPSLLNFCTFE